MRPKDAVAILLGLPFAARLAGSVRVPPPHGGGCCHAVSRHRVRATEPVPASSPQLAIAPLRHDVLIPKQYAVKRSGGGDQIITCLGPKYFRDHLVDRRVLDTEAVVRSSLVRCIRAPIAALLISGQKRLTPGKSNDI